MKSANNPISKATGVILLMTILLFTACHPADHSASLKPIVDAYLDAWNTGELDDLDQIIDADFVRTAPATANSNAVGIDSLKSVINGFRAAFPDLKITIDNVIYSENTTTVSWTVTGTNTGPMGMPPTGKSVEISGISIAHYTNGKMSKEFAQFDNLEFEQQLGFIVLPPAAPLENDPIVTDPDHYKVIFENDRVRAIRISYGPNEKSIMHDHYSGVVIFMDDTNGRMTFPDGTVVETSGKAGDVIWSDAESHQPENLSNKSFEVIFVELKN